MPPPMVPTYPFISLHPLPNSLALTTLILSTILRTRDLLLRRIITVPHSGWSHTSLPSNTSSNLPKRNLRLPPNALTSNLNLIIEFIDLFQCEALGFVDHEVDEGYAEEAAGEPDEEDFGLEVCITGAEVHEVGSGVGNCPR
jgi:hypothetical protein